MLQRPFPLLAVTLIGKVRHRHASDRESGPLPLFTRPSPRQVVFLQQMADHDNIVKLCGAFKVRARFPPQTRAYVM